jgi:hypothetical protein
MKTHGREYLNKYLEKSSGTKDEKRKLMDKLKMSLSAEPVKYNESGTVDCKKEFFELKFSYRRPSVEENKDHFGDEALRELAGRESVKQAAGNYWIIDSITLTNLENNFSANITDDLPSGFLIVYHPLNPNERHRMRTDAAGKYKFIDIFDDLTKPYTLVALLHELGHARDYATRSDEEKKRFTRESDKPEKKELADLLIKERNAWAYAIQKLKRFLNNNFLNKDDLLKIAHQIMLLQYSHGIRLKLMEIDKIKNDDEIKKLTDELDQEQKYILGIK